MKINYLAALVAVAAAASVSAAPAPAAKASASTSEPRLRLVGNALFALSNSFDSTRTFTLYAESGTLSTSYKAKAGLAGDLGLQFNFSRHVGVIAAFELGNRNAEAAVDARVPHPLYVNRLRTYTTTVSGLSYDQTAGHLGLAVLGGSGSVEYTLFAGGSYYQVKADLLQDLVPAEVYPYDTFNGSFSRSQASKSALGFHGGGRLDFFLSRNVGIGAQVRYGSAKVKLSEAPNAVDVTAGGLEAGGGLRLRF